MRIIFDVSLLFLVLFAPLWLLVAASLIGLFFFVGYFELIGAFFLYDLLYFGGTFFDETRTGIIVPLTVYAFLAVLTSEALRRRIRER